MPPIDPTAAPDYVRVPVETLVDYRSLLLAITEARAERVDTRKLVMDEIAALRVEVRDHVLAERPVLDAYHRYLQRLDSEETGAAASAVASRRTAEATTEATWARIKSWLLPALFAAGCIAGDRIWTRLSYPSAVTITEIGAQHDAP